MATLSPDVLRLTTAGGVRGTAFLINSRYALTAGHCVPDEDGAPAKVTLSLHGRQFVGNVIWRDNPNSEFPRFDAAILEVARCSPSSSEHCAPPLSVARFPQTHLPNDLHWRSFGYPVADPEQLGLDLTGSIAGIQLGDGFRRLQLTCDQFGSDGSGLQGASGGPVIVNASTVALISRSPKQFKQRIVHASLLEDVFAEFFRAATLQGGERLLPHVEQLRAAFGTIKTLELDHCDRALNQYLKSLRRRGGAFHELAVRTPRCTSRALESSPLGDTYVQASLHKIAKVHDFWTDESECLLRGQSTSKGHEVSLTGVIGECCVDSGRLQLLVTGEAGGGKTTLLNYIGLNALFAPSKIGLDSPLLPMIVSLPELAKVQSPDGFDELKVWLAEARMQSLQVTAPRLDEAFFKHDFFDEFPSRVGARWLILLDGFDEVPELVRNDLRRWFRECVVKSDLHWCLTSRPAKTLSDPIIDISQYAGVRSYKILPWTDSELREFATAVLGSGHTAGDFLEKFRFIALDRSTTTPLLTLIAICVYEQNDRNLPRTKTELYDLFLDNAVLRGLQRPGTSLPEWIDPTDREPFTALLSQLALYSVDNPSAERIDELHKWLRFRLQEMSFATALNAAKRAREFIEVVAVGSGLLVIDIVDEQEHWRWWHATVRDYLASLAIATGSSASQLLTLDKWEDPTWQEVVIFMMAILSVNHLRNPEQYPDVTHLFQYLLDNSSQCNLLLFICLAEGAAVDEDMENVLIEELVRGATRLGQHPECEEYDEELGRKGRSPIELLAKLSDRPAALTGLKSIADDLSIGPWMRTKAEEALARIERTATR